MTAQLFENAAPAKPGRLDSADQAGEPVSERLVRLRAAMVRNDLAAYVVPSSDPHLSEYLPERWQGRWWLSGFTGSAGTLVVSADFAGVWTDSRYWTQAEAELAGSGIVLMKMEAGQQAQHIEWLAQNLPAGACVGVDGAVLALAAARALADALQARGISFRTDLDLLDAVWSGRSGLPDGVVYEHELRYACVARAKKLDAIRHTMREKGAQWHFVSTLDDLAWLTNLRGADVNFNPVFVGHALIGLESATLFVAAGKVPGDVAVALARDGIRIEGYERATSALAALPAGATLLVDPRRVTYGLRQAVPAAVRVVEAVNPSTFAKSRKTPAEIEHVRATMEQDGAALAEFFAWFEGALGRRETVTELTIDERLAVARARRPGFVSASFATIAGFNANGAMPHYRATEDSHATITGDGLLLIDSGGQYVSGTTDITRVAPVGAVTDEHRRDFTLVLKGMIALSRARFPRGIRSPMLDAIARAPIWEAGADYGHGTGHGVGYFLNVHEGPQVISHYAPAEPWTAMEEGMITSVEPGIYRPGRWGVRIENLVLNRAAGETEFGAFLDFETLTLCPIDTRCIALEMMRDDERAWLNAYHETVRGRVSPHVTGDAKAWLETRTQAI